MTAAELPEWTGKGNRPDDQWVVRVFNNLFPRIPAELTAGRNESYIVVEDPRHYVDSPRSHSDLLSTAMLGPGHFRRLLEADVRVMRLARKNHSIRAVVVRKNQGRESGASQPHPHQQIIGSPEPFPAVAAEARAERETPGPDRTGDGAPGPASTIGRGVEMRAGIERRSMLALSGGHLAVDFASGSVPALIPFLTERFHLTYALAGALLAKLPAQEAA